MTSRSTKTISIALCTYNGERYLQEQLDSIAAQTVLPDELVVCDDLSSDSTKEILQQFAVQANFPVKLHFNPKNLGFVKNFEKAISLCTGDIIFLSDQDDVWRADKIEVMEKYFSDPTIGMVFSNAETIDATGNPLGRTLWEAAFFTSTLQKQFRNGDAYKALYLKPIVSGCTMAFERHLWSWISPLPPDIPFIHDAWIAFMTSLYSNVILIDQPLINYRIHSEQSAAVDRHEVSASENIAKAKSGAKYQQYRRHLQQLHLIRHRLQQYETHISTDKLSYLKQRMAEHEIHLISRTNIGPNVLIRCLNVIRELSSGRYHRFSNGFKSAIGDLIQPNY